MSTVEPLPIRRESSRHSATRLALISRLADGRPWSIAQLTGRLNLTRQRVGKHLRVLKQAGVVTSRRVGRESRFVFMPEPILDARGYLDRVSDQWDDALSRLKAFVEE